jgi:cytoskeletal protein RodZ
MAEVNIRDTGRNSAKTQDVRALASRVDTTNPDEEVITTNEVKTTTGTIAVTDDTNTVVTIAQPAGTILMNLIAYPAGNIVTGGTSGNDLDFFLGTASAGVQLVAATALLDDGGAAVTWTANVPLFIIENAHGKAANQFATTGVGPKGGPATTEAIVIAGALYSAAARSIYATLRPIGADLATAATTVTYIAQFQEL